jgi:NTE family protein
VPDLSVLMMKIVEAMSGRRPAEEVRKELGAIALAAKSMSEEEFIGFFSPMLQGGEGWPAKSFACTAVDTADGSFTMWTKDSGICLGRAVASSCSVPGIYPPITFRGKRYMDGGTRSTANADMAKGYDAVLVVVPTLRPMPPPIGELMRARFDAEINALEGSRVEVIGPDAGSLQAFGMNLMDASRRGPSAKAGLEQGRAAAAKLADFWR